MNAMKKEKLHSYEALQIFLSSSPSPTPYFPVSPGKWLPVLNTYYIHALPEPVYLSLQGRQVSFSFGEQEKHEVVIKLVHRNSSDS